MSVIRTAISLQADLLHQVNEIAAEQSLSRSRLIVNALQEYIERYKNRRLFDMINAAYEDDDQEEELATANAFARAFEVTEENVW